MKTLITSFLLMSCLITFGQSNLVIFSEDGQPFHLLVNGKAQNADASSNVRVTELSQPNVRVKVKFTDEKLADIDKTIMLESNMEYVAVIKPNRKGELKLRYQSSAPIANSTASAGQSSVIYNPNGVSTTATSSGGTNTTSSTQTTTTVKSQDGNGENVSVNINMSGIAESMKQAAQSVDASISGSSSSTTTSTTTTTSGNTSANSGGQLTARVVGNTIQLSDGRSLNWKKAKIKGMVGSEVEMKEPLGAKVTLSYDGKETFSSEVPFFYREKDYSKYSSYIKISVVEPSGAQWSVKMQQSNTVRILIDSWASGGGSTTVQTTTTASTPAPAASGDCAHTMSSGDFESAKSSISSKTFEDSKMTLAKQIGKSNCFTTDQVKAICNLFTYEDSKLEFAKFAYSRTRDKGNYFKVNDVFTYESSIDELNAFLEKQ